MVGDLQQAEGHRSQDFGSNYLFAPHCGPGLVLIRALQQLLDHQRPRAPARTRHGHL